MPLEESERWLAAETPHDIDAGRRRAFIAAIRPNVLLPKDVARWRDVVFGPAPQLDAAALARVHEAGAPFFRAAAEASRVSGGDLNVIVEAIKGATGAKGQSLWKPLRLALTGSAEGPELAPLLKAMNESAIHDRLNRFAA
jgi:glutamyl/glutaminyl-tRNA synthetase